MIHTSLESLTLTAQRSGWRHYGYREYDGVYFESNAGEAWVVLALMAVVLVGLLSWQFMSARARGLLSTNSPSALFRELCRAHRLSPSSRRLLKRLAIARGLASPAVLFVQPEGFDATSLPIELNDRAGELARLAEKLFATSKA